MNSAVFRRIFREFVFVSVGFILLIVALGLCDADRLLSAHCRADGVWSGESRPFGLMLTAYGKTWKQPAFFMAVGGLLVALAAIRVRSLRTHWRAALFFPLMLALGPGLVVNVILKDHWGRPRPNQVRDFGGDFTFQQPWEPGNPYETIPGKKKPSFTSGHASMAFYVFAPWFVLRRRRFGAALAWLGAGLIFGVVMSAARITQGAHFLTDCVGSCAVVYLTGLALSAMLPADERRIASDIASEN